MFSPNVVWLKYVCPECGAESLNIDNRVWVAKLCMVCEKETVHHIQWAYPLYEEAKRIVGVLWTKPGYSWARCVVCGRSSPTWRGHHIVSQRYKAGKSDVRNIVPVCSATCHSQAHGEKMEHVFRQLCVVLGNGYTEYGEQIFNQGKALWLPKTGAK